jgi:hypothetical protein
MGLGRVCLPSSRASAVLLVPAAAIVPDRRAQSANRQDTDLCTGNRADVCSANVPGRSIPLPLPFWLLPDPAAG